MTISGIPKLLKLEDYTSRSIHEAEGAITAHTELGLYNQCVEFVTNISKQLKIQTHIMCTAYNLMHSYLKKVPFTVEDRLALCCVCVYTACKIDYRHQSLETFISLYLEYNKSVLSKKRVKHEGDLKTQLMVDFCTIEIGLLNSISYEMEFDIPLRYRDPFNSQYLQGLKSKLLQEVP